MKRRGSFVYTVNQVRYNTFLPILEVTLNTGVIVFIFFVIVAHVQRKELPDALHLQRKKISEFLMQLQKRKDV